jgi:hypothetical protein
MSERMGETEEPGIIDVSRRRKQIREVLDDPTLFPVTFTSWLKRFMEASGATWPASSIIGTKPAVFSNLPAGISFAYLGESAPAGTVALDGSLLQRAEHPRLFDVLGTRHGSDSEFDFRLPNQPTGNAAINVVTTGK